MKILVVSRSVASNNPQAIRMRMLLKYWQGRHECTVLTFNDNLDKSTRLELSKVRFITVRKKRIQRLLTPSLLNNKRNSLRRVKQLAIKISWRRFIFPDVYIFSLRLLRLALRKDTSNLYDSVIISSFPFSFLSLAKPIRKYYGNDARVILDLGDPISGNEASSAKGFFYRLLSRFFEKYYLRYISLIVVPSKAMMSHYSAKFDSLAIVPQGYNSLKIDEKLVFEDTRITACYIGSFYRELRDPSNLFEALNSTDVTLNVYGRVQQDFLVESEKVIFHGVIDNHLVNSKYSQSTFIVFIDNSKGIQLPGKIYEVLNACKPVLFISSNSMSPARDVVCDLEHVILVENDIQSIRNGIPRVLEKVKSCIEYPEILANFSWNRLAEKYPLGSE